MCTLKEITHVLLLIRGSFKNRALGVSSPYILKGLRSDTQNYIEKFTESEGGARARAVGAGRSTAFCPEDSQRDELCTGKHQSARMAPSIIDIISKKRDGHELTRDEIEAFVRMVIDGTAQDCQIGLQMHFF